MTSHDDLIARAEALFAQVLEQPGVNEVRQANFILLAGDLTAALKECREQSAERSLDYAAWVHNDTELLHEALDALNEWIAKDDLVCTRDVPNSARIVASKIKERLNG